LAAALAAGLAGAASSESLSCGQCKHAARRMSDTHGAAACA
jgi:hypothetical protein